MALPCETYQDSNSQPYMSVPDCCYWETPCLGCPWLLSGLPGITTQCLTRQFGPTSSNLTPSCSTCSTGYSTSITNKICCYTSDSFDVNTYCATVSPCVCSSTQTHALFNPMLAPPTSTSISPLQCVSNCKAIFASEDYYQLAYNTCLDSNAFSQACPSQTSNSLGQKGTQRTLIQDGVCDVSLNLVSVDGSSAVAQDLGNEYAKEKEANLGFKVATYLLWIGVGLFVLGIWGNRAYIPSKVPSIFNNYNG